MDWLPLVVPDVPDVPLWVEDPAVPLIDEDPLVPIALDAEPRDEVAGMFSRSSDWLICR